MWLYIYVGFLRTYSSGCAVRKLLGKSADNDLNHCKFLAYNLKNEVQSLIWRSYNPSFVDGVFFHNLQCNYCW